MATGKLQIQVTSQLRAAPVEDAVIDISSTGEPDQILEEVRTDSVGQTDTLELEAPPEEYSLSPGEMQPYSEYNFRITAPGYEPLTISGAEILANQLALQDIRLKPLAGPEAYDNVVIPAHTLYGDYPPKIAEAEIKPLSQSGEIVLSRVVIPEFIVVHDGAPTDSTAGDYYVRYRDYIKNVASSEIYATWPKAAIRANVLAIMSFTLNRVYTEWYRNKGFDFTITSSTAFDHKWIYSRNIFESISEVVDELFADYLSRPNVKQPILTQYCDGKRVSCPNWLPFLKQRTNITFKYETTMIGIICCTFTLRSRGAFLYPLHFLQINPSSTAFQLAKTVLLLDNRISSSWTHLHTAVGFSRSRSDRDVAAFRLHLVWQFDRCINFLSSIIVDMITGMLIRTLLGFLQRFKCPDLAAGVIPGLADTIPWFRACWKNIAILTGNGFFERIPGVCTCIVYIRIRADFPGHVIVTDHMVCRHIVFFHQVSCQLSRRLYRCSLKIPVFVCCVHCFCGFLPHAHLNADAVRIPAFRVPVAACPTMPGNVFIFYALPDFAGETDKIMCGCPTITAAIVCTVFLCSAQCPDIMDHNIFDPGNIAGIIIVI